MMMSWLVFHLARLMRPRADHAHLPFQDIKELRQLINAPAAQEAPDRGNARIIFYFINRPAARAPLFDERLLPLLGMHARLAKLFARAIFLIHGAKLVSKKVPAAVADALVSVDNRPARLEKNYPGRQQDKRTRNENHRYTNHDIKQSLQNSPPAFKRCALEFHDRHAGNGVDAHVSRKSVEKIGRVGKANVLIVAKLR